MRFSSRCISVSLGTNVYEKFGSPLKEAFSSEQSPDELLGSLLAAQCILSTLKHDSMLRLYNEEYAPLLNEIMKKRLLVLIQSGLELKNVDEGAQPA